MSVKDKVLAFLYEEEGLTTVEYAIAGALVAMGVVFAFTDLGEAISTSICKIVTQLGGSCT